MTQAVADWFLKKINQAFESAQVNSLLLVYGSAQLD